MAAGEDPAQIIIAPSGTVYVAPVSTTEPASEVAVLNAAFKPTGLIDTNGVGFSDGMSKGYVDAWQRFQHVKTFVISKDTQINFTLLQWFKDSILLAFGGGTITQQSAGHYKFSFADPAAGVDERCMSFDWVDGVHTYRMVIPRVSLASATATTFVRSGASLLPLTFDVLGPETGPAGYILTDNPGWYS